MILITSKIDGLFIIVIYDLNIMFSFVITIDHDVFSEDWWMTFLVKF